jgi:hypothetical protein
VDSALALRWRRATFVASAVAVLELAVLVAAGVYLVGRRISHDVKARAARAAVAPPRRVAPVRAAIVPRLPRSETSVLVLNGNGIAGAATAGAARLTKLGYVIGGVGDAPQPVVRTTVMYSPGFRAEAERLARDLRVHVVGPLDGLRPTQLMGAHLALVLGRV